jgi:hypothetical protein
VTDAPQHPEWLIGTARKDWLRDGYTITEEQWADLGRVLLRLFTVTVHSTPMLGYQSFDSDSSEFAK